MDTDRTPSDADDQPNHNDTARDSEAPWRPFVQGLRAFIARRVPADDADDVLQETLARLHEAAPSLRNAERAEAWVFSIARRAIADHYRQQERDPVDETLGSTADVADSPSSSKENLAPYEGEHTVHEEVLSWLRPMAEELPEMYRRPLVMADFEGHTQQEVADELGLSLSGAKSRVQRARAKLGDLLRQCCEIEFGPESRATAFRRREAGEKGDL